MRNDIKIQFMSRAAVFGGSFNPPHLGHLLVAQTAIATAGLDRLYWIPTHRPPHKAASDLAPLPQRAYMSRLALADNRVCRVVCEPEKRSGYALDTFEFAREREPNCQWSWLLGLDAFARLPYWYQREELAPAVDWLVAPRLPAAPEPLEVTAPDRVPATFERTIARLQSQGIAIRARLLLMAPLEISSTVIRDRYAAGLSCSHLLPGAVERYIAMKGLYGSTPLPAR